MPKYRHIKFLSLFSGCGGFDLGFSAEKYICVKAFDSDPIAVSTYNNNHRRRICGMLDLSEWRKELNQFVGKADVVIAGPPCQGFSVAGKRKLNDPRNHLLLRATEIAVRLRPSVFVLENVMATRSGRHKTYWRKAIAHLRANGYDTTELTLDCSRLGVPQMRRRVVLVASRLKPRIEMRLPLEPVKILRDALVALPKGRSHHPVTISRLSRTHKIISRIGQGQQLSNVRNGTRSVHTWNIPEVFGKATKSEKEILEAMLVLRRRLRKRNRGDADPLSAGSIARFVGRSIVNDLHVLADKNYVRRIGSHFDLRNTFNGKYRRLSWDKPSYTVDTRFGVPRYFIHPDENRGFTVREAARIQGFPDTFNFPASQDDALRLIGNAVPPPAAQRLAASIKSVYFTDHG